MYAAVVVAFLSYFTNPMTRLSMGRKDYRAIYFVDDTNEKKTPKNIKWESVIITILLQFLLSVEINFVKKKKCMKAL